MKRPAHLPHRPLPQVASRPHSEPQATSEQGERGSRQPGEHPVKPTSAGRKLGAALRRFRSAIINRGGQGEPDRPEPATDWERRIEERLAHVEAKVTNQNRLLLISIVAILADTIYKAATR